MAIASERIDRLRLTPPMSRRSGFWGVAFSFLVLSAFSTAPSSLYAIYEHSEYLSSLMITIVYAIGIVVSLLLAGHMSDWYGRRAVLLPAIGVAVLAAIVFLVMEIARGPARRARADRIRARAAARGIAGPLRGESRGPRPARRAALALKAARWWSCVAVSASRNSK